MYHEYLDPNIKTMEKRGVFFEFKIRKLLMRQQIFSCVKTSLGNKLRSSSLWLLIIGCSKNFDGGVRMHMYVAKTVQKQAQKQKKRGVCGGHLQH